MRAARRSGSSAGCIASSRPDILAVYDDLDLPLGRMRLRAEGGAGGHNGVASLIAVLGKGFPRLRIGIGRPPGGADPVGFVLEPFDASERPVVEEALARAADGVESWLRARPRADDERAQPARCRSAAEALAIHAPLRYRAGFTKEAG